MMHDQGQGESQGKLLMHGELVALHFELIKSINMVIKVTVQNPRRHTLSY